MTIIAAIRKKDEVWIMADRQISWGQSYQRTDTINGNKLIYLEHAIIGFSGTSIYKTALRNFFQNSPEMAKSKFETKADVLKVFYNFRRFLKSNFDLGAAQANEVGRMEDGSFIIATANTIYEIASNFDVIQFGNYSAIGSGGKLALGALDVLYDQIESPSKILKQVYQTVCKLDSFCSGDIDMINVTKHLQNPGEPETQSSMLLEKASKLLNSKIPF